MERGGYCGWSQRSADDCPEGKRGCRRRRNGCQHSCYHGRKRHGADESAVERCHDARKKPEPLDCQSIYDNTYPSGRGYPLHCDGYKQRQRGCEQCVGIGSHSFKRCFEEPQRTERNLLSGIRVVEHTQYPCGRKHNPFNHAYILYELQRRGYGSQCGGSISGKRTHDRGSPNKRSHDARYESNPFSH